MASASSLFQSRSRPHTAVGGLGGRGLGRRGSARRRRRRARHGERPGRGRRRSPARRGCDGRWARASAGILARSRLSGSMQAVEYPGPMTEPLIPSTGWNVLHLFCAATPLADGGGGDRGRQGARGRRPPGRAGGHRGPQGRRLPAGARPRPVAAAPVPDARSAAAGLDVVDSYVSLTEVSEYAEGMPEERKHGPAVPPAAARGQDRVLLLPDVEAAGRRAQLVRAAVRGPRAAHARARRHRPHLRRPRAAARHRVDRHRRLRVGRHALRASAPTTSRPACTRCATTRPRRGTPSSARSSRVRSARSTRCWRRSASAL